MDDFSAADAYLSGWSIQQIIRDVMAKAKIGGTATAEIVLQHLVEATLEVALAGRLAIMHHTVNTSDAQGLDGIFDLNGTVIHVSTTPGEALLAKCADNVAQGLRPIIVTTEDEVEVATRLAGRRGLLERVEIYAVEQFVSINANELGLFDASAVAATLRAVIDRYNAIVGRWEIDPSLRIAW